MADDEQPSESRSRGRAALDLAWPLRAPVGVAFASIVALTIAQVVFRFALDDPLIWSEELARLLLVWVTFTGAAVVAWDGTHLNVDLVLARLPARARAALRWFNLLVAIGFCAVMAGFSLRLIRIEAMADMAALGIPFSWVRMPALVGGVLIVAAILARRVYRLRREGTPPGEPL